MDAEQAAFHQQMRDDPRDATVRAVYADWLDEHDQPEAAAKLRWWAQVLPHMPEAQETMENPHEVSHRDITLPEWAQRLALTHFDRRFGHIDPHGVQPAGELHALGLAPEIEDPYSPSAWLRTFRREPDGWNRVRHMHTLQEIAKRIGAPVKLAAIPPAGSGQTVTVRVPTPQPVVNRPKPAPAPTAPTFILPG